MDPSEISKLRENANFEAKSAIGGLPKSMWETYCSFANTDGGMIVLGASEGKNHSLNIVGVEDAESMVKSIWDTLNNHAKVSLNLLSERDVTIEACKDKKLILVRVPRAERTLRPIYLNHDIIGGTFRRNGEGDYRCSESEVKAMLRDADEKPQDRKIVPWSSVANLNLDSVYRYRNRMRACRPGHVWLELDDEPFLRRLGALSFDENSMLRATCAGLLMFGNEYDIVREFPSYFLDYQERFDADTRWTDRVISTSGEWSGNLFDFYFRVYNKIEQTLKVPFLMIGQDRIDDTPMHKALREALANCLVNADYRLPRGVVIIRDRESLTLSNPGSFRVPVAAARSGGISDPRNETILKMFTLIDIGERAGSGIPTIESVWNDAHLGDIKIKESFEPSRVSTILGMPEAPQTTPQTTPKTTPQTTPKTKPLAQNILDEIKENPTVSAKTISEHLGIGNDTVREYISKLKKRGVLKRIGPDFGGHWEIVVSKS